MKKIHLFFTCFFASLLSFSQNNLTLVIFSEDLEPFYAYINGVKQNARPETNVRVTNLSPNISLRVEFENKVLPVLRQNMSLEAGYEHTARIRRDKNNQLKLRYMGQVPLAEAQGENVPTVEYHTAEEPVAGSEGQTGVTHVPQTNTQTTTSSTVTHSSSTSSSRQKQPVSENQSLPQSEPAGCRTAMSNSSFVKMKESIASKSLSDTKMSTARVATKNACLSIAQVKEIARLFNMDDDKLAYAKFAYDYCVDKNNYYQVSEVFSFSTNQDRLNKFLEDK